MPQPAELTTPVHNEYSLFYDSIFKSIICKFVVINLLSGRTAYKHPLHIAYQVGIKFFRAVRMNE
jgi:hypothetical protein